MIYNNELVAKNEALLPNFNNIVVNELEASVDASISHYQKVINSIASDSNTLISWESLIHPIEDASCNLEKIVNIVSHLNSVKDSPGLRTVYSNILPKLSNLNAEFFHNKLLYEKILQLKNSASFIRLSEAQKKIVENILLDFKLAGIDLGKKQQQRYKEITSKLSELSNNFSKNVLDSVQSWSYYVSPKNKNRLIGMPKHFISLAKQKAIQQKLKKGWLFTLDAPCVDSIMRYSGDRSLREIVYKAYVTKASGFFKSAFNEPEVISAFKSKDQINIDKINELDNSKIMQEIIMLRSELALLLGFTNYSEYSLAHKMAKTTTEVKNFLDELAIHSIPYAKKEFLALQQFAKEKDNIKEMQPWDLAFYSEQYKEHQFNLSEEELRNYFPLDQVLSGIFTLAQELYGIKIEAVKEFTAWDPDIKLYKVTDKSNELRGYFYVDLYVRENKQSGAWMANCLSRHKSREGILQYPVAFLVTNFSKPLKDHTLLYHQELTTLLHEFGHVLHHILTKVDYISVAGCNGVSWDAVELPSQFMEKWSYDWDFLYNVSFRKDSSTSNPKKISKEIFNNLIGIKNYQAGMFMVRQLEFGIFDFNLHMWQPDLNSSELVPNLQKVLDQVRSKVTVIPVANFNRFQNSFSHIFAGGYAAGYYSYNWAEVLASDAFLAFTASKITSDKYKLGSAFLSNILEMGGAKDAMDLYIAFKGSKPDLNSLLIYKGLK